MFLFGDRVSSQGGVSFLMRNFVGVTSTRGDGGGFSYGREMFHDRASAGLGKWPGTSRIVTMAETKTCFDAWTYHV
jgi:hypothetical protein